MLRPNPWNLGAAGNRTGPLRQDSGGDPDRSQSQTGLAHLSVRGELELSSVSLKLSRLSCTSGLSDWEAEGIFPPTYSRTWAKPMPTLNLNATV